MNINPVETANPQFQAKNNRSVIKLIDQRKFPIDKELKNMLKTCSSDIETLAKKNNLSEVKLAGNGASVLINTGAVTSCIERSAIENAKDLYSAVETNVFANQKTGRGLAKALDVLK